MTPDQWFHVGMAGIGLLLAIIGALAKLQLTALREEVKSIGLDVKVIAGTVAHLGERTARAEADVENLKHFQIPNGRAQRG